MADQRMIAYRCKDCLWWDNQHTSIELVKLELGKTWLGFCRRRRPGPLRIEQHYYGVHPVMDADEFCGEFKGA